MLVPQIVQGYFAVWKIEQAFPGELQRVRVRPEANPFFCFPKTGYAHVYNHEVLLVFSCTKPIQTAENMVWPYFPVIYWIFSSVFCWRWKANLDCTFGTGTSCLDALSM